MYNNLVVNSISLDDAYELISNYVVLTPSDNKLTISAIKATAVTIDDQGVAHFMAENKKLKKSVFK